MNVFVTQVLDEVRNAARFRWVAIGVAWAVCAVGWLAVLSIPDKYQASARIFVSTRTALTPVIEGLAIQQDVNAQLNYVQQSLLGAPRLEKVALQTGLYDAKASSRVKGAVARELRENTSVNAYGSTNGGATYVISYVNRDRQRTLDVVNILLTDFVEDTLGGKRSDAEAAQQFLTAQIGEYEQRLSQAEQRLAEFKKRYVGVMPGEQGDYFTVLQKEIDENEEVQAKLTIATKRREELARQLRGEADDATVTSFVLGSSAPGGDTAARLKETEARLDQLLLMYTEKHPDVVALRETLAQLKERRESEMAALRRGDPGAALTTGASSNPIYQSIQLAMNQNDVEIAALRGEIADRQSRIAELRKRVDTVPEVEAEYARLNRDYNVTKGQYTALVERLERARLGDQAEVEGSVRFEVVDPPAASFEPISPKRKLLLFAVLVAGIGAGGAAAYLLHFFKPVFSNSRALHEITGLPVLGVVSLTWLDKHRIALRRSYALGGASVLVLIGAFVVVFKFNQVGTRVLQNLIS